jgi:hypothetical protein
MPSVLALLIIYVEVFASVWIRKRMAIAIKEIEAERALSAGVVEREDELDTLDPNGDTSYKGANTAPYTYQGGIRSSPYQPV